MLVGRDVRARGRGGADVSAGAERRGRAPRGGRGGVGTRVERERGRASGLSPGGEDASGRTGEGARRSVDRRAGSAARVARRDLREPMTARTVSAAMVA